MAGDKSFRTQGMTAKDQSIDLGLSPASPTIPLGSQDYAKSMLRLEVATYIGQMSAELSTMARNSDMQLLSYFLDMAAAEARAADDQLRDLLKLGADPDSTVGIAQA